MHGAQREKNISQYFCAFYCKLFSDYSCSSMEYAVQEIHRYMNFLSSIKIIWILAESCMLYLIVIILRLITAQQIHTMKQKKLHVVVQWWTKEITPLWFWYPFGSQNWFADFERNIQLQYIKLNIFEMGKALHGEYENFNIHVI